MSFLDLLKAINSRWYLLVIGMIAGGLLGFGATFFKTPVYEANAVFTVTIDYTQTGALSDVEEDQAMRAVGDVIFSDEVVTAALDVLKDEGLDLTKDKFYDDAVFEREEFRWAIRYRDEDPKVAYQVVQAWAEVSDQILQDSLVHARLAASYLDVLNSLEACLERNTQTNSSIGICSIDHLDEILEEIANTSSMITTEKNQSRGLFSALAIVLSDHADIPSQAVRYQTNVLVISGVSIGLLLAIILLTIKYQYASEQMND